jgi:hypothetical protein
MKISFFGDTIKSAFGHAHAFSALENFLMTLFSDGAGFDSHDLGFL